MLAGLGFEARGRLPGMAHINDVPTRVTGAGLGYSYTDPPELATIALVNAPLDPDHTNIGVNRAAYDTFINGEVTADRAYVADDAQILNPEFDLVLPIPYETAVEFYNYGRLTIAGRDWYVFYTAQYLNKTSTKFVADIDEVASYDWTLGYSQIERGHVAVAASQADTYGSQYLTAPEPIEAPAARGVLSASLLGSAPDDWTVLVVSANDLRGEADIPFWDRHVNADLIASAANLATIATIDRAAHIQTEVPEASYPWAVGGSGAPIGTPTNGFVPDAYLAALSGAPDTLAPAAPGPVQAELNTAAAFFDLKTAHPSAEITGPAGGYWSRALDIAVHANPSHYGVVDTGLSPIGHSPHGLGIRINISGVTPSEAADFGFTEFNSFTYTFAGPYSWDEAPPGALDVYAPKVVASPVSTIDGVAAGGGVYLFTMEGFAEYMTIMQGAPWVTSGIIDVRLVPAWAVGGGGDATFIAAAPSRDPSDGIWATAAAIPNFVDAVVSATESPSVLNDWRTDALAAVGATGWTKLITSQFTDLLVGNGESVLSFRPDQWQTPDVGFKAVTGAAHGDPSIRLIPTGYNELGNQMGVDSPVGGQAGLTHSGFGIAASQVASQDMTPYLNAFSSYQTWIVNTKNLELAITLGLTNIQLNAGVQGIQTVLGGAQSAAGGALAGGASASLAGQVSGAVGSVGGLATAGITASNTITMLDISQDGSFDIGAFQLGLSGMAGVAAFDAWFQSLSSSSGGGSPHRLASGWRAILAQAFQVVISMPSAERVHNLVSQWKRYGYMIGQAFTPQRLDPMTKMSYWKTTNAAILGAMPQQRRQTISQAFDRGTTVWTTVAEIGTDVTGSNVPRAGIAY